MRWDWVEMKFQELTVASAQLTKHFAASSSLLFIRKADEENEGNERSFHVLWASAPVFASVPHLREPSGQNAESLVFFSSSLTAIIELHILLYFFFNHTFHLPSLSIQKSFPMCLISVDSCRTCAVYLYRMHWAVDLFFFFLSTQCVKSLWHTSSSLLLTASWNPTSSAFLS